MLKLSLYFFLFIFTLPAISQKNSVEKELIALEDTEQAEAYIKKKSSKKNKLIIFNEEKHKTPLSQKLFKSPIGGTQVKEKEFEKTYYKVIEKEKKPNYRVAYIYINGEKFDLQKVNSFRNELIAKYNNSTPFDFLAKRHSMDRSASRGGDSGWFSKRDQNSTFETLIIEDNHDLNDIFTLDIPSESGYYIVLKTHEPKDILEIKVLKIVEARK